MGCNLALVVWGIYALLKPGGARGEELAIVYWWVVPLIMVVPAKLALDSWLNRWRLTKSRLFLLNVPFAFALGLWAWVATRPI